jgi:hypothetical protein
MKRTPLRGGKEPETTRLQAVGALCPYGPSGLDRVTACLLHNDPASYRFQQVKAFRAGATGKPSLNRAHKLRAVDAKP